MSLVSGARLGTYGIIAPLGAGGMGEVYRGRDMKLDREVAIKILPDALAHDPERLARFEREAKVLASLNHPNIAQIYGIEESSGVRALVMELVPGETLAEAEKTPLPLETTLNYARQIAEALETAHEKGIVHRDLKPANVMITPAGVVKVLDFGLAAMPSRESASGSDPHNSPTFTMAATQAGFIMGTAGYMAPEQAAGKPVDKRADIWAFGVVLFEMLSGERLFDGETVSHTLADVLRAPIDFGKLPKDTPPSIRNLVERCLDRNVKNRLRDIGEARVIIDRVGQEPAPRQTVPVPQASGAGGKAAWAIAGLFIVTSAILAFVHFRETPAPQRVMRFQITTPEKVSGPIFELSPDGRTLAFTASEGGRRRLWIRPIDSLAAQPVPATEDASYMFWSPDSAYIGFFVPGKLKKIALSGGPAQTLCDASDGRGGTWNQDGVIVFSPGVGLPMMRVAAAGGTPAPVTKLDVDGLIRYPSFLPDGKRFLFEISNSRQETNGIYAGSLDGSPPVRVLPDQSSATYVASSSTHKTGLLLFRRDGTLMAQPFDPGAVHTSGDAFPVAEEVGIAGNTNHASFSVSANGVLAYSAGGALTSGIGLGNLQWIDRNGKHTAIIGQPADILTQSLSPDGKQVVLCIRTMGGDGSDLWILDVARGVPSRFTFRPGRSMDGIWSPDGNRIIFQTDNTSVYEKPASGAGKEELLLARGLNVRPQDWSRDGRFLAYMETGGKTGTDLWLLPLEGDHKPAPYLQTPFNESDAQFSPDGHWMAYVSNESGPPQVYVQSIPASGTKFQISSAGGVQPRWRRDGNELFYISTDNKLTAVPLKIGETIPAGTSTALFDIQPIYSGSGLWAYEPSADGQRFLVLSSAGAASRPITVVLNWQAEIKR
ncbi:MAG: protein kinase domain-containing protein [Bryobacteraceae bacterium]